MYRTFFFMACMAPVALRYAQKQTHFKNPTIVDAQLQQYYLFLLFYSAVQVEQFQAMPARPGSPETEQAPKRNVTTVGESRVRDPEPLIPGTHSPLACLLYTSPSPRDRTRSRMPSSA